MPAGIGFPAAEMSQRLLFLSAAISGVSRESEADGNNFVSRAGIEREHAQHADDALFDLIAKHGQL